MSFERDGYFILRRFIEAEQVRFFADDLQKNLTFEDRCGARNLEQKIVSVADYAHDMQLNAMISSYLCAEPRLVRAMYFNKTADKNWGVLWHQDKTISVSHRVDVAGWGPWTLKEGVTHVQPPVAVLDSMLTVRIHLDTSDRNNGCLRVIPASHKSGLLDAAQAVKTGQEKKEVLCEMDAGDVLIMRPHILHASSRSREPKNRRIIHLEYSCYDLPQGLCWN